MHIPLVVHLYKKAFDSGYEKPVANNDIKTSKENEVNNYMWLMEAI